jgi:hypothetical protein
VITLVKKAKKPRAPSKNSEVRRPCRPWQGGSSWGQNNFEIIVKSSIAKKFTKKLYLPL